jgi:hypothetical protein
MGSHLLTAAHAGSRAHDGPASERVSSCLTVAIERGNAGGHSGERVHSQEEARGSDLLTVITKLADQGAASFERATLTAWCGRAAAANPWKAGR